MAKFWIVESQTQRMVLLVESDSIRDQQIAAASGAPNEQIYLAIPEDVAPGNCKVHSEDGVLSLVDGASDKMGPLWDAMRVARTVRIEACRWLVERHRDQVDAEESTSLTTEQYQAWLAYRQALRDLPAGTVDPEAPTWPTEPGA